MQQFQQERGGTPPPPPPLFACVEQPAWNSPTALCTATLGQTPGGVPIFSTVAELTLDSGSPTKGRDHHPFGSPTRGGRGGGAAAFSPPPQQLHLAPQPPQHTARVQQLEQQNADLLGALQALQAQLEGLRQVASSEPSPKPAAAEAEQAEPRELAALQRRLDAKAREAAAAAQAAEAAQAAAAQREGELEAERERCSMLADELALCRDEVVKRDKETKALAQRLETATGQIGLLDDSLAALKKRSAELTTALSQRDVSLRQLEDRLHAQRGAEGSRGKQAEALQGELAAALGERDALRRECSALRDQSRELEEEVQRLHAAVQQALKGQAAAARGHSRDLELIAAAPSQLPPRATAAPAAGGRRASGGSYDDGGGAWEPYPGSGAGGRYETQASSPAHLVEQAGWEASYRRQADSGPAAYGWADERQQQAPNPRSSMYLQPQHPYAWHEQSPPPAMDVRGSYAASSARDAFQHHRPSPLAPAPGMQQQEQQAWGVAATPQQQRASPEGGDQRLGLHTPGSAATSPFATDDTLQDMLARTHALESRLQALMTERNELLAEAARMPCHTQGRTLGQRQRREAVEARLEALAKETSSVRLALRRLGVK